MDSYLNKKLDGRYRLTERIGEGGMAYVYRATDLKDGGEVAVKIMKDELLDNPELVRRFKNESLAVGMLHHENIVKVLDVNYSDSVQYIVMELLDGVTLKDYIDASKPLSWKNAVFLTEQLLEALQHAHDRGIVHRDIKPQNVMLSEKGVVKVMDFGIARFARTRMRTVTDKAIGTVHYISPEQAKGDETDARSDLYSTGVMLYEMVTGKLPFTGKNAVAIALRQISDQPEDPCQVNPAVPRGLGDIILRAMEKDPDRRYQTAGAMLLDLQELKRNPEVNFYYGAAKETRSAGKKAAVAAAAAAAADTATFVRDRRETREATVPGTPAPAPQRTEQPEQPAPAPQAGPSRREKEPAAKAPLGAVIGAFWKRSTAAWKEKAEVVRAALHRERETGAPLHAGTGKSAPKKRTKTVKTIDLPLAILMGFSAVFLIASILLCMVTLKNGGSQLFTRHDDVDLPDFVGLSAQEVLEDPANALFHFRTVEEFNSEFEKGLVFDQTPVAPKTVKDNANITLYVSKGPRVVRVPDVIGRSYGEAMALIREQGLAVRIETDSNDDYAGNIITRVEPSAGTPLESGSAVTIFVNSPVASISAIVPQVVGMEFSNARATLVSRGLVIGEITEEFSEEQAPGTVLRQSLEEGITVPNGTTIDLVIATDLGTYTRDFLLPMPYTDPDGSTVFDVTVTDEEGNEIGTFYGISGSGLTLTREGSEAEPVLVEIGGVPYARVLLDYQEGTCSVLEDYSEENGFVNERPLFSIRVECSDGGTAVYAPEVYLGGACTVTFSCEEGFELLSVTDNGEDVTGRVSDGVYVLDGVEEDHEITATFGPAGG